LITARGGRFEDKNSPRPRSARLNGELDEQLHFAKYGAKIKSDAAGFWQPRPMWPRPLHPGLVKRLRPGPVCDQAA